MEKATQVSPKIEHSWKQALEQEFSSDYFNSLKIFLQEEKKKHTIYPPGNVIFNAFNSTPLNEVKVVILGQDPYHGPGQAHGLSFSVQKGVKPPPSLKNICKELNSDLGVPISESGLLQKWADQGVFLLNATLTVRAREAGSHQKTGWETFTDAVIKTLSDKREGIVFMLWGRFAQNKSELINQSKHLILKAAHPSPFSAHNGFFGCKHFSKANTYLVQNGCEKIDWSLD